MVTEKVGHRWLWRTWVGECSHPRPTGQASWLDGIGAHTHVPVFPYMPLHELPALVLAARVP